MIFVPENTSNRNIIKINLLNLIKLRFFLESNIIGIKNNAGVTNIAIICGSLASPDARGMKTRNPIKFCMSIPP